MNKRDILLYCWTVGNNDAVQMLVSLVEFEFLQTIADVDINKGEKTWVVNNRRFKFNGYV